MTRKLLATTVALLLVTASVAYGQQPGDTPPTDLSKVATSAGNFLKLPVGARALALGSGGIATIQDATAIYWNPAGIGGLERMTFAFNQSRLYAGINHSFAALVIPLGLNTRVGFSLLALDSGEMKVTTTRDPLGTGEYYKAIDSALGLTVSQVMTDRFTLGVTAKWVLERIQRMQASGVALDVGSSFNTGLLGTRLGMAILNVGTKMRMQGPDSEFERQMRYEPGSGWTGLDPESQLRTREFDLPLLFRMGFAMDVIGGISTFMTDDVNRVTALVDVEDAIDQMARVGLAFEYSWQETLYARFGYRLRSKMSDQLGERLKDRYREQLQMGYGFGLKSNVSGYDLQFDYGAASYADLGIVNQFFLSLGF